MGEEKEERIRDDETIEKRRSIILDGGEGKRGLAGARKGGRKGSKP